MLPKPPEATLTLVQANVRADHVRIRAALDELTRLASTSAQEGGETHWSLELTGAIWGLFLLFDDHLAMEERDLVPLLERTGVWGKVQVERMQQEHRQQRTVLLATVDACDDNTKAPAVIANNARWLVESLRRDMDREEREFESIRDDGFVADQFTG